MTRRRQTSQSLLQEEQPRNPTFHCPSCRQPFDHLGGGTSKHPSRAMAAINSQRVKQQDIIPTYTKLPLAKLPSPDIHHVLGLGLVQRHNRLTPVLVAKRDAMQGMRVEEWPVSPQRHTHVPQSPADDAVAAAIIAKHGKPLFRSWRFYVLSVGCRFAH